MSKTIQFGSGFPIPGSLTPTNASSVYPLFDPAHGLGGFRNVNVKAELIDNSLFPLRRRQLGMTVYVEIESVFYVLSNLHQRVILTYPSGGTATGTGLTTFRMIDDDDNQLALVTSATTSGQTPTQYAQLLNITSSFGLVATVVGNTIVIDWNSSNTAYTPKGRLQVTTNTADNGLTVNTITDGTLPNMAISNVFGSVANSLALVDGDWLVFDTGGGIDSLGQLTDVTLGTLTTNEILKYNSTTSMWENSNVNLNEIGGVTIGTGTDIPVLGHILYYNPLLDTNSNIIGFENVRDPIMSNDDFLIADFTTTAHVFENLTTALAVGGSRTSTAIPLVPGTISVQPNGSVIGFNTANTRVVIDRERAEISVDIPAPSAGTEEVTARFTTAPSIDGTHPILFVIELISVEAGTPNIETVVASTPPVEATLDPGTRATGIVSFGGFTAAISQTLTVNFTASGVSIQRQLTFTPADGTLIGLETAFITAWNADAILPATYTAIADPDPTNATVIIQANAIGTTFNMTVFTVTSTITNTSITAVMATGGTAPTNTAMAPLGSFITPLIGVFPLAATIALRLKVINNSNGSLTFDSTTPGGWAASALNDSTILALNKSTINIDNLHNVRIAAPLANNQVLEYNLETATWINVTGGRVANATTAANNIIENFIDGVAQIRSIDSASGSLITVEVNSTDTGLITVDTTAEVNLYADESATGVSIRGTKATDSTLGFRTLLSGDTDTLTVESTGTDHVTLTALRGALNDLTDVDAVTNLANGDILVYDTSPTTPEWRAKTFNGTAPISVNSTSTNVEITSDLPTSNGLTLNDTYVLSASSPRSWTPHIQGHNVAGATTAGGIVMALPPRDTLEFVGQGVSVSNPDTSRTVVTITGTSTAGVVTCQEIPGNAISGRAHWTPGTSDTRRFSNTNTGFAWEISQSNAAVQLFCDGMAVGSPITSSTAGSGAIALRAGTLTINDGVSGASRTIVGTDISTNLVGNVLTVTVADPVAYRNFPSNQGFTLNGTFTLGALEIELTEAERTISNINPTVGHIQVPAANATLFEPFDILNITTSTGTAITGPFTVVSVDSLGTITLMNAFTNITTSDLIASISRPHIFNLSNTQLTYVGPTFSIQSFNRGSVDFDRTFTTGIVTNTFEGDSIAGAAFSTVTMGLTESITAPTLTTSPTGVSFVARNRLSSVANNTIHETVTFTNATGSTGTSDITDTEPLSFLFNFPSYVTSITDTEAMTANLVASLFNNLPDASSGQLNGPGRVGNPTNSGDVIRSYRWSGDTSADMVSVIAIARVFTQGRALTASLEGLPQTTQITKSLMLGTITGNPEAYDIYIIQANQPTNTMPITAQVTGFV